MERQKCFICGNEGFIMYRNKLICGECLLRFKKDEENKFWENLKKDGNN